MAGKKKKKFYAYFIVGGESGVTGSWPDCEALTSGRSARYRGFPTEAEARAWLEAGARYDFRPKEDRARDFPEDAIFFDAGTGGGGGTRARVTDRDGVPLAHLGCEEDDLTPEGNVRLPGRTNNFGELYACNLGLRVAMRLGSKLLYGDSKLVINYWSLGHVSKKMADQTDLVALARETAALRKTFEKSGGVMERISGDINPADLGFHKS
ncbi:MAG: RNase H1/viroplasmin domain-containing protein [Planctomycetota bacterium]|jgi:ribonuclease HI